jgi:uncharacterized protein
MLIMKANTFINFSLLLISVVSLTGCIGGSTPPSQFYLLEPINESTNSASGVSTRSVIALGPVRIARYIDRPQIVTSSSKNAYQLSELNRWAESLDGNISRVLAQNLSFLAPVDVVLINSSSQTGQAQLRVSVNILEFHVNPQGQAGLTAQWRVFRGEEMQLNRQLSYRTPASATDYPVMVAALNECLNRMSQDMAASIQQVLENKKASIY